MSVKTKAILIVCLVILTLTGFNLYSGLVQYNRDLLRAVEIEQAEFDHIIETSTGYLFSVYGTKLQTLVEFNDQVAQAFAQRDRKRLYQLTRPIYQRFKQENPFFSIMHFHLPDGTSFLRVHEPKVHGDNLGHIRPAIQYVHEQRRRLSGFEIGIYGPFYRVIEPVFSHGRYVGVAELGIDAQQLVVSLRDRLQVEAASYFNREMWGHASRYQGGQIVFGDQIVLADKGTVFAALASRFNLDVPEQRVEFGGKTFIAHAHAILNDFTGKPIGGILSLQDITPLLDARANFVGRALLFSGLLLVASFVVLYLSFGVLIGRLEQMRGRQEELIENLTSEVDERRQIEVSLLASEDKLRAMVESLGDHVVMVDGDLDIVWANDALRKKRPGIVGRRCYEAMRHRDTPCPQELCLARQSFGDGLSHEDECRVAEDGEEVHYRCTANVALRYEDGSPATVIEMYRDITEMKQAEEALQRMHHRNQLLLDAAGEGIYGVDLEGKATFANPAALRLTGFELHELVNCPQHELLHHTKPDGSPYPVAECPVTAAMRDGQVRHVFDELFWCKDGRSFPVEYVATPIREAGEIVGAVVVFSDVTERKQLEGQLLQSQKMEAVGRLAGGIAHDFNNLLTTILGYSELTLQQNLAEPAIRRNIEAVVKAGQSAAALTRQLLAFSRKQMIVMREVDLGGIVSSIGQMIERTVGEDVRLTIHVDEHCGVVRADPGQMEQVIMNLVVNARGAMPRGGVLVIETSEEVLTEEYCRLHQGMAPGRYALLSVSDTGVGMSSGVRERIFEPFYTTKPQGEGTGLGLATVHGIVQQHGGQIFVYSEEGKGSTFKVFLPVVEGGTAAGVDAENSGSLPVGSETILVVDDNEAVCTMVSESLAALGYRVFSATSGEEALIVAADAGAEIDLLLTDLVMPGINGWELAEGLFPRHPEMRVLVMSGYTDKVILESGVLKRGVAFVHKPVVPSTLAVKVRQVLDRPRGGAEKE